MNVIKSNISNIVHVFFLSCGDKKFEYNYQAQNQKSTNQNTVFGVSSSNFVL